MHASTIAVKVASTHTVVHSFYTSTLQFSDVYLQKRSPNFASLSTFYRNFITEHVRKIQKRGYSIIKLENVPGYKHACNTSQLGILY